MENKLGLLQVSRGVAAMLVVLLHCYLNSVFYFREPTVFAAIARHGWVGVEYFFVLSGFIITYIHWNDLELRGKAARFLKKRFIRIYPIYWLIATVMLLYYLFLKKEESGISVKVKSASDVFYLAKCYVLYPLYPPRKNFIDSAWTLSYEVLFYLVFATGIKAGLKTAKNIFLVWAVFIAVLYYTGILSGFKPGSFLFNPIILYFLAGCFIAYLIKGLKKKASPLVVFAGIIIAAILFWIYNMALHAGAPADRRDIVYNYLFMIILGLLLWGIVTLDTRSNNIEWPKLLLLIGDASYSIYLIHIPVVLFFYKICNSLVHRYDLKSVFFLNALFVFVFFASLLTGVLVHKVAEKRLLAYFNKQIIQA